jgi:hypothetical protein
MENIPQNPAARSGMTFVNVLPPTLADQFHHFVVSQLPTGVEQRPQVIQCVFTGVKSQEITTRWGLIE